MGGFAFSGGGGGGGAPTTATYITQTPDGSLSAEQALSLLATGLLKNTTGTGVLSIAAQGTDYYAPGGTDVAVVDGGTGASSAAAAIVNLGAAPSNATFITQVAESGLSAEQSLAALATGYVKVTTTTGVLSSQAVPIPATDGGTGQSSFTVNNILYADTTTSLAKLAAPTFGKVLGAVQGTFGYGQAYNSINCQTGDWEPQASGSPLISYGILAGTGTTETVSTRSNSNSSDGIALQYSTSTVSGNSAAVTSGIGIRRDTKPFFIFKFNLGQTANCRMFIGLSTTAVLATIFGTARPGASHIGLSYDSATPDTNFQFSSDLQAGASPTLIDTTIAASTNVFYFVARCDGTQWILQLYDANLSLLTSSTTSTDIPAATQPMSLVFGVSTLTTSAASISLFFGRTSQLGNAPA